MFNPWGQSDPMDLDRYTVLTRWEMLQHHFDRRAKFLLIGEAPGYRGCHFSGVPFTSEALIAEDKWQQFGFPFRMTTRPKPWGEASATVVWRTLHTLGIAEETVMWNAFPFHPFQAGEPYSNRAPTLKELNSTRDILGEVVEHFKGAIVVAIGQVAMATLNRLGMPSHCAIRHPSMGGAKQFAEGLKGIM